MSRISQVDYALASPGVKEQFDDQIAHHGRMTNMKRTLLHSLSSYTALMEWYPLYEELQKFLSDREIDFYCYAISTQNACVLCSTYFRKSLKDQGIDLDAFSPTGREDLLMRYGKTLAEDPNGVSDALFAEIRFLWSEEQTVALTAFAALMIATNLINSAFRIPVDDYLAGY